MRTGHWDERSRYMGRELRDRTLGAIGLGGIGRATVGLLAGFGMKTPLAFDPFLDPRAAAESGVRSVGLDELLAEADFVSIHCPLTDQTRGLIGARELALMKPDAYLINTARGGIVDEDALYDASGRGPDRRRGARLLRRGAGHRARTASASSTTCCWPRTASPGPTNCSATSAAPSARGCSTCRSARCRAAWSIREVFDRPGFQEKWARCGRMSCRVRMTELMSRRLEGQTAWISGAASGIGEATARLFAEEGANVALVDVARDRGEAVRRGRSPRRGGVALVRPPPTSRPRRTSATRSTDAVAEFGGLNILVNCAGMVHVGLLHEYDEADWDRLMAVNVKGIFFSVKHGLPLPATQPAQLRGQHRLDQQLRRPGRDAGLHGLEGGGARAEPIDRAGLRRARPPLQLRLPGHHRHADAARASGQDARPRGDAGRSASAACR